MNRTTWLTFFRFMRRSKTFTAINLIGLTAGLTVAFLLMIYIINELSFNSFHDGNNRLFRVLTLTRSTLTSSSPVRLFTGLDTNRFGAIQTAGIISLPFMFGNATISSSRTVQEESALFCADPGLLEMLTFRITRGEGKEGLAKGGSVLVSASAARTWFGEEDPLGQPLGVTLSGIPVTLTVTGVFEDLPWNSTLKVNLLAGKDLFLHLMEQFGADLTAEEEARHDLYSEQFIRVDGPDRITQLEESLPGILEARGLTGEFEGFQFQNIRHIHLDDREITNDFHRKGNRSALVYYGSLALVILLLAGINYSILSTARSALRYKEIGVRKVLGASQRQLRLQILAESILLTLMALPLTFLAIGLLEPFITRLYGYEIQLYTWNMLLYIPLFALITSIIGAVSGVYLAFYLSALQPLKALKKEVFKRKRVTLGTLFITFQLLITLILFSCVLIIFSQLDYCLNPERSIPRKRLLILSFGQGELLSYPKMRDGARQDPLVVSASGCSIILPSNALVPVDYAVETPDSVKSFRLENYFIDSDFFATLGLTLLQGSDLSAPPEGSVGTGVILNQQAVSMLKLAHPVGYRFQQYTVEGVAPDFAIHSFYSRITPALFIYRPSACTHLLVQCLPGTTNKVRASLERMWQELNRGRPFNCTTYSDELHRMYEKEQDFGQVVASFSFLAFIITGMGLFGLALLLIERRLKEIAVRKIFGASDRDIHFRMQKEFLIYILAASVAALPATWYIMELWLSTFYYRVAMPVYLFLLSILFITIFVSSIIMVRTWTVLRKNQVNSLRYE